MKKISQLIFLGITFFLLNCAYAASDIANSPVGFWKTIDDVTGKPKAIVQIWETPGKRLYGRVLRIYPRPGYDQNEVCTACQGEKHNKRIVGMVILENLTQDKETPTKWVDGQILDPLSGKTYHCTVDLIDNGQRLNVRGYIGVSMFGRTQTWLREMSG